MVNVKKGLIFLIFLPHVLRGQENKLTLEDAYRQAQTNYPVIRQKDLVRQTAELNINNLSKGQLPQLSFNGQASYQSDVTRVDVPVQGIDIPTPQKDQYKVTADISQVLFDGGTIKEQKVMQLLNAGVEEQKVEVELYKLKERINQIYLGILYLDEQVKQLDLVTQDIQIGMKRVEAQVNNGVAFKSNLNVLKAELLKTKQRVIEIRATRKGYVETLGLFLNQVLNENIKLEKPAGEKFSTVQGLIQRPELKLYNNEIKLYEQQNKIIQSKNLPKASLFFQGGYGRPGLNMLDNQFDLFYIGGVKLNWPVSNLYTKKKEKQLIKVNQQIVDTKKETFLLTTNTQLKQQQSDIEKFEQLIATDKEIIEIRTSVKDAAKAQLENGVITANDYLREVNAEDQARQALITHELQLLQATINYKTISGIQ